MAKREKMNMCHLLYVCVLPVFSVLLSSFVCVLQVLCSNSVLDSSEYWLRNEKALCRLGLLDDDAEGSCTTVSSILRAEQRAHRFGSRARPSHFYLSLSCRRCVCGTEQQQRNSGKFQGENDT